MSPYIWFGLAMLAIVIVSLLVTGNLAARFNERAKSDLDAALDPLAKLLSGEKGVDAARVVGRHSGQIVSAQVISGPGGMGRLFQTTMVEPAGGEGWSAVVRRPRDEATAWEQSFVGTPSLESAIGPLVHERLTELLPYPGWFEAKYDPQAGAVQLTRAMQSRRDLPTAERFARYLDALETIAAANRSAQNPHGTGEGSAPLGSDGVG